MALAAASGDPEKRPPNVTTSSTICHHGLGLLQDWGRRQRHVARVNLISHHGNTGQDVGPAKNLPEQGAAPQEREDRAKLCRERERGHLTTEEDPGDEALQHLHGTNPPTQHLLYHTCNTRCHALYPQPALLTFHQFQSRIFCLGRAALCCW